MKLKLSHGADINLMVAPYVELEAQCQIRHTHTHTRSGEKLWALQPGKPAPGGSTREGQGEEHTHTHTRTHTQAKKKTSNDYENNAIGIRTSKQIQVQCDTT